MQGILSKLECSRKVESELGMKEFISIVIRLSKLVENGLIVYASRTELLPFHLSTPINKSSQWSADNELIIKRDEGNN